MPHRRYTPTTLAHYASPPPLLHLQFGERVTRYVAVESFAINELDEQHRLTPAELAAGLTHEGIRTRLIR